MALKRNIPVLLFTGFPFLKGSLSESLLQTNRLVDEFAHQVKWKILAEHILYQKDLLEGIMPKGTRYISSLRNPVDQLKSMFHYFDLDQHLGIKSDDPVSFFLNNIEKYSKWEQNLPLEVKIRNKNAVALGVGKLLQNDASNTRAVITENLGEFSWMIITEYMDESLVLLRRQMCWDVSDMFYLSANVRSYPHKSRQLDQRLEEIHRKWSQADHLLYNFYNESLWKILKSQTSDFWEELQFFQAQKHKISDFCSPILAQVAKNLSEVDSIIAQKRSHFVPGSKWGPSTTIEPVWCLLNKFRQLTLRNILRVKQYPQLCQYVGRHSEPFMYEFNINNTVDIVTMHPSYCKENHPSLGIPLEIFQQHSAYLWTQ